MRGSQLRAGDTLVILDPRGTRTFRGPGTFSASAAAPAGPQTVQTNNGRRARIGAVRNAGIVPTASPTSIWDVDASQSGTTCLAASSGVRLWRADASQAATLNITGPNRSSAPGELARRRQHPRLADDGADRQRRRISAEPQRLAGAGPRSGSGRSLRGRPTSRRSPRR